MKEDQRNKIRYLPHAIPNELSIYEKKYCDNEIEIVFIGRFNDTKGADYLLQIGKILHEHKFKAHFNIITDGINEEQFKGEWVFTNSTVFYNSIENHMVLDILSKSHVILMPSRNEGLPIALIEAMRHCVVPICSNLLTGFGELVFQDITGYLFDNDDLDQFAECIVKLDKNRELLKKISKNCKQEVNNKFDPYANIAAFSELYTELATYNQAPRVQFPRYYYGLGKLDSPLIPNWVFKIKQRVWKTFKYEA